MFSHAQEVIAYTEERQTRMRVAGVAYLVVALVFTIWRATTFNPLAPVSSTIFYIAEVFGLLLGASIILSSWRRRYRESPPLRKQYTVDVFVPVYNEPIEMIRMTAIAASEIEYPHETYLLDDGPREELRAIAEEYGIHYITRSDNSGAKAGNLNHALKITKGEIIAIFDADHIAQREALEKMLGFMDDDKVAMLQTPQAYYNEDSFLYSDNYVGAGRWHEQAQFMDLIQAGFDSVDASTGMGTGVIYRRSALDLIGGFPTTTLTEDLHCSLLFHKRGLKSAYLNQPVAWGVAAADVSEFYKTRRRWAHGNLHGLVLENVLFCSGLGFRKRSVYLTMLLHYLEGWQQLIYLLMPVYCLLTYRTPFLPTLPILLSILIVPVILCGLTVIAHGGYVRFFRNQIFAMGKMFILIMATQGLIGRKLGWQVSLKNVLGHVSLGMLGPHIVILGASALALIFMFLRLIGVIEGGPPPVGGKMLFFFASGWVAFNLWRSWRWISETICLTRLTRDEYLFETRVPILDGSGDWIGVTEKISTTGCHASWSDPGKSHMEEEIIFQFPGGAIPAKITETYSPGNFRFEPAEKAAAERLWRSLYSVDWHRQLRLAEHSLVARRQGLGGRWLPALLRQQPDDAPQWTSLIRTGEDRCFIITTDNLSAGDEITIAYQQKFSVPLTIKGRVRELKSLEYPFPGCLNGETYQLFDVGIFDLIRDI